MEASRRHLCALPLPHSSFLLSPAKEFIPSSGALTLMAAAQRTAPEPLALVARGLIMLMLHTGEKQRTCS